MSAKEGLYAHIYLGTACPAGTANTVALLTGVSLSWDQSNTRFYGMGSVLPADVLRGPVEFDGGFTKAYVDNSYLGTVLNGTYELCGSICPRGTVTPAILGTLVLNGGSLSDMAAGDESAVIEDHSFIIYNISFA